MRDYKRTRAVAPAPRARSYTAVKAEWEALISAWARHAFIAVRRRVFVEFTWCEANAHRDPDGISSGGRKFLLDGLVKAGVLPMDGHAWIAGFQDAFELQAVVPGVTVELMPEVGIRSWQRGQRCHFPHRLPDLNELLALREASARRSVKASLRGRVA